MRLDKIFEKFVNFHVILKYMRNLQVKCKGKPQDKVASFCLAGDRSKTLQGPTAIVLFWVGSQIRKYQDSVAQKPMNFCRIVRKVLKNLGEKFKEILMKFYKLGFYAKFEENCVNVLYNNL